MTERSQSHQERTLVWLSTIWEPEVCPVEWQKAAPGSLGCWNEQGEGTDLSLLRFSTGRQRWSEKRQVWTILVDSGEAVLAV